MKKAEVNTENNTVTIDGKVFNIGDEVKSITPEERFLELIKGAIRKFDFDKHPDIAAEWSIGDEVIIREYNIGYIYVSKNIWEKLKDEFDYSYNKIQSLIREVLKEKFNITTPPHPTRFPFFFNKLI